MTPSFTKALNLDEVQEDMRGFTEEAQRAENVLAKAEGRTAKTISRISVLGKGISSAFGNLKQKISDPAVIFTTLADAAFSVSQDITDIQRSTGMSYKNASLLNAELRNTAQNSGQIQISVKKIHEAFVAITKETGMSAEILGTEALISMSNLNKKLGLGVKESVQLTQLSRLQSKNTEGVLDNTIDTVESLKKQNKSSINVKSVLEDVGSVSKSIAVSLGSNPESIASAAFEARQLGLSLSEVDAIADSLLQFETSIQNELEAELITGKQLNLEKARQLALDNDLNGLSKELAGNQQVINAFATSNRIEQQAMAKAMGMTKDQLAKIALQQEFNTISAEEFTNRYGEATYQSLKASSASENFGQTLEKVKDIIGNIGMALAPILDGFAALTGLVANVLSKWYVLYPLLGVVALSYVPKIASGFAKVGKNIKNSLTAVRDLGKGLLTLARGKGSDALKETILGKSNKVKDVTKEAGDKMKPGKSAGIKENLQGLGEGLKAMAGSKVTQGILNLALAGPALVLALPAIPFLLFMGLTPLSHISSNLENLAEGLENMSGAKVLQGIGNLALAGASLLLALPSIPFLLFIGLTPLSQISSNLENLSQGLENMSGAKVLQGIGALALAGPALVIANLAIPFLTFMALPLGPLIQSGLTGLANGLSSLGNNFASVAKGALALTILSASLIPAAFAFNLLSGVDPSNIMLLSGSLIVLGVAAALLGNLGANIIMGASALGILGLALIPAAFAFSLLEGVDVGSMIAFSVALPLLALATAGLGFLAPFIMAGAAALAVLGLALIPAGMAFGMITGLDTKAIMSFSTGVAALALTVAGLGLVSPLIIAGSLAISALGLALIPLSIGFERMAGANVEGLVSNLKELSGVAPQLFVVASGLGAISAGLMGIAGAGLLALPAIGALSTLGVVSEGLESIFGGKSENTEDNTENNKEEPKPQYEGSLKMIEQKLDKLINVISEGGDVYIDGSKVGKTLQLASSRLS